MKLLTIEFDKDGAVAEIDEAVRAKRSILTGLAPITGVEDKLALMRAVRVSCDWKSAEHHFWQVIQAAIVEVIKERECTPDQARTTVLVTLIEHYPQFVAWVDYETTARAEAQAYEITKGRLEELPKPPMEAWRSSRLPSRSSSCRSKLAMSMTREDWQDVDGREAVHAIDDEYQVFAVEVVIASPSAVDVDRLEQVLEHSTAGEAIALGLDLDGTVQLRLPNHEIDGEAMKHAKLLERAAGEVADQRFAKDLWLAAAESWDRSRSPVASTAAAQCRAEAARIE